jgi:hypothetical protein
MNMKNIFIVLFFISVALAWPSTFPTSCYLPNYNYFVMNNFNFTYNPINTTCIGGFNADMSNGFGADFFYNRTVPSTYNIYFSNIAVGKLYMNWISSSVNANFTQNYTLNNLQIADGKYNFSVIGWSNGSSSLGTGIELTFFNSSNASTVFYVQNTAFSGDYNNHTANGTFNVSGNCYTIGNGTTSIYSCGYLRVSAKHWVYMAMSSARGISYITGLPVITQPFLDREVPYYANSIVLSLFLPYYAISDSSNGVVVRTDATGINYTPTETPYSAYVFYGTYLITPIISYFPADTVQANYYNASTGVTYLLNNTGAYLIDGVTRTCYFVAPYIPPMNATIYTVTATLCTANEQNAYITNPTIYLVQNCYVSGNTYFVDIQAIASRTFAVQTTDNASTVNNYAYTTSHLSVNYTIDNGATKLTNVSIISGNMSVCAYQQGSYIFFNQNTNSILGTSLNKIVGKIFILGFMVIGAAIPYSIIIAIALNDSFQVMSSTDIFLIFSFVAVISLVNSYFGARTLKALGIYVALGVIILGNFLLRADTSTVNSWYCRGTIDAQTTTSCQPMLLSSLNGLYALVTSVNIYNFLIQIPLFLINSFIFFLSLPALIADLLVNAAFTISPMLGNVLAPFQIVLTLGIYFWLLVKGFEIIHNQFREV